MTDAKPIKFIARARKKLSKGTKAFIILMLAYPVVQFCAVFFFVNARSLLFVFQKFSWEEGKVVWNGFNNIKLFFTSLNSSRDERMMLINSLLYFPVTCLISLPLSIGFSYFLYKKMPLAGVFRIIFFLPSIIPVVALTLAFRIPFDPFIGFIGKGIPSINFWGVEPNAQIMVFTYCIWAGLGYNIILLSGAVGRIPADIFESARLDGVGPFRELVQFVVPLCWPTIVTLFLLGMTSVLTVFLQPLLLTEGRLSTNTIALSIYKQTQAGMEFVPATTGLICSAVAAPIILLVRKYMSRLWSEVEF